MIKHISQISTRTDYKKAAAAGAKKLSESPIKVHFFPKYPFPTGAAPALLIGEVPPPVLAEVKKIGGKFMVGKAAVNEAGEVAFDVEKGSFDGALVSKELAFVGVAKPAVDKAAPAAASAPDKKLKSKALGANYKDEDKKAGWRTSDAARKEDDNVTTKYYNEEEKAASKAGFDAKGRMVDAQGKVLEKTEKGFVMDPKTGDMHLFDQSGSEKVGGKTKNNHHSSPLAGGDVAGAGVVKVNDDGRITEINDQSGHYKPDAGLTHQVVKELGEEKDAEGFSKKLTDRTLGRNKPANVKLLGKSGLTAEEFEKVNGNLDAMNALIKKKFGKNVNITDTRLSLDGVNFAIGQATGVTLTTQQFEQTEGNEKQIRKKIELNKELKEKVAEVAPTHDSLDALEREQEAKKKAEREERARTKPQRRAAKEEQERLFQERLRQQQEEEEAEEKAQAQAKAQAAPQASATGYADLPTAPPTQQAPATGYADLPPPPQQKPPATGYVDLPAEPQ